MKGGRRRGAGREEHMTKNDKENRRYERRQNEVQREENKGEEMKR